MPGFEDERLVKLRETTAKENVVTGNIELCFKFELDASYREMLIEHNALADNGFFQNVSLLVSQLVESEIHRASTFSKAVYDVAYRLAEEMENKSDDQGKN